MCVCVCVSACVCERVCVFMRVYLHVYIQAYLCSMHTHIPLPYITLHYIPYSWIALHCITLDYIALHYKPQLLSSPGFDTGIVGWGQSWGVRGVRNAGSMWNIMDCWHGFCDMDNLFQVRSSVLIHPLAWQRQGPTIFTKHMSSLLRLSLNRSTQHTSAWELLNPKLGLPAYAFKKHR